jgi:GGDEF domain-containing protein
MNQREQRERVEFLYESMRATQGAPEFGLAVGELLVAAVALLRADYAEILLLSPVAGEEALQSVSGQDGERLMQRVTVAAIDERAIGTIAGSPQPILLARRGSGHPLDGFLRARGLHVRSCGLTGEQRTFGVLLVGDRVGDVSTFAREDVALLETFASHASVLLENGRLERSLAQVTELKEELHHQAYTDALTQLPNRLLFTQRLDETLADEPTARGSHAVLFLDLNRFKVVNDSWWITRPATNCCQVADRSVRRCDRRTLPRASGRRVRRAGPRDRCGRRARAARRLIDVINAPIALSSVNRPPCTRASASGDRTCASTPEEAPAQLTSRCTRPRPRTGSMLFEPALHHRIRARRSLALELGERPSGASSSRTSSRWCRWSTGRSRRSGAGLLGTPGCWLLGRPSSGVAEETGLIFESARAFGHRPSGRRASGKTRTQTPRTWGSGQRRAGGAHRRTARASSRGGDDAGEDRRAADDGRITESWSCATSKVRCVRAPASSPGSAHRRFRYRVILAVAAAEF